MAALVSTPEVTPRPTGAEIDALADRYTAAKKAAADADAAFEKVEKEAIDIVTRFGVVPPKAESSRRLEGILSELTMTTGNTVTIDETRVQDLKAALVANKYEVIFPNLFQERVRHELMKGADEAIIAAGLTKRTTEKLQALFGRCFDAKKKKPSLKVKKITVQKVKRSKKAVQAEAV